MSAKGVGRPPDFLVLSRFELFPELSGTPYVVQLARLGEAALQRQGVDWHRLSPQADAPPECRLVPETGHRLCPPFLAAWDEAGGLDLVGLPLTEAMPVTDAATGEGYRVQYFERTRIEEHPSRAGTPYAIQLGLLVSEQIVRWGGMP